MYILPSDSKVHKNGYSTSYEEEAVQNTCIKISVVLDCPQILLAAYHSRMVISVIYVGNPGYTSPGTCSKLLCLGLRAAGRHTPKHLHYARRDASFFSFSNGVCLQLKKLTFSGSHCCIPYGWIVAVINMSVHCMPSSRHSRVIPVN